jgi:hypothetical protein
VQHLSLQQYLLLLPYLVASPAAAATTAPTLAACDIAVDVAVHWEQLDWTPAA